MTDKKSLALKDTKGKAKISLIPMDLLRDLLIPTYLEGIEKYERDSCRKGFLMSDMYDALQRHLIKFY